MLPGVTICREMFPSPVIPGISGGEHRLFITAIHVV